METPVGKVSHHPCEREKIPVSPQFCLQCLLQMHYWHAAVCCASIISQRVKLEEMLQGELPKRGGGKTSELLCNKCICNPDLCNVLHGVITLQ